MFKNVLVKNFLTFKELNFNLMKNKSSINKFIAIYGENGSGKTSIVKAFDFLQKITSARVIDTKFLMGLPSELWKEISEIRHGTKLSINISDYRMIDEKEPTELKYDFDLNGIYGTYYIKFTDEIIDEELKLLNDKKISKVFEIKNENSEIKTLISSNFFFDKNYNLQLNDEIKKLWGKYSFLSLLALEIDDKNEEFIYKNISDKLINTINYFLSLDIYTEENVGLNDVNMVKKQKKRGLLEINAVRGKKLPIKLKDVLLKYERSLTVLFTNAYADVKKVKYDIIINDDTIDYTLYFYKVIGNKVRRIPALLESEGTRKILKLFNQIKSTLFGDTVIIDEIDNGIHDLLMEKIIMSLIDEITGQLIITTHNTNLIEDLNKNSIYILISEFGGNKKINSISNYKFKTQKNNNIRKLYLQGVFGGIPICNGIEFDEIKQIFNEKKEN